MGESRDSEIFPQECMPGHSGIKNEPCVVCNQDSFLSESR